MTREFDLHPLAPAQWALWAALGETLLGGGVDVELTLPGTPPPDADEVVRDLLWRHEALATTLEIVPGVLLPVQRIADDDAAPDATVTTGSRGVTVRFRVPTATVDSRSLCLLAEQLDAALHGRPAEEAELGWFDVHDWNERRVTRREASTAVPERMRERGGPVGRAYQRAELPAETVDALRAAATALDAAPDDVLAAALGVLAGHHPDVRPGVGRVLGGRPLPQLATVVGRLDLLVPVEVAADAEDARSLVERVRAARDAAQQLLDDDPFLVARDQVAAAVDPRPWYGVSVAPSEELRTRLPGARITTVGDDPGPCSVLLTVETDRVELRHETGLFSGAQLRWWDLRLRAALRALAAGDPRPPTTWQLVGPEEQEWIGAALRGARGTAPVEDTVVHRIRRTADERPDAVAVVDGDRSLTYAELVRAADGLAGRLTTATPDGLTGLAAGRLSTWIVGALGIMTAGHGFLPLDGRMPPHRRDRLLRLAGGPDVLGDADLTPQPAGPSAPNRALPSALAYAIATSGSTGEPKLVGVEHRNLCAYAESIAAVLPMPPGTRVASPAAPTADLGYTTVFPALAQGATIVAVPEAAQLDPVAFADTVAGQRVDVLKITPTHLEALLVGDIRCLPRRTLVLGGEVASAELLRRIRDQRPDLTVLNHYGPTETTVGVFAAGQPAATLGDALPVGRPLPHTVARVVTAHGPAAVGAPGELRVSGAHVARGYLGDPRLTADRFRPVAGGGREYRTGDLVALGPDGLVRFRGRLDDQVKIRGHRVEPREVERELAAHPAVRQAAVVVDAAGGRARLLAFAVASAGVADLREHLTARLPEAWLPAVVQVVDRIPLAANGKVDRAALVRVAAGPALGTAPPRHDLDRVLVAIWSELIGVPTLGVDANVFESGGHSLTVTQVASRLREYLDADVTIDLFFAHPTIAGCSDVLLARPDAADIRRRAAIVVQVLEMSDDEAAAIAGEPDGR
ncbi:AMP-binding protein [Micromonospora sp. URMC 107]|uniref:non-ribosomal peptide synthetase n=1 Tax=Micromonospora sp. URMC 107 TaxID=3423418 RepID=UPI003F19CFD2